MTDLGRLERLRYGRPARLENTWKAIENALRPIVQDDAGAAEVASAFYDVAWVPTDSAWQTYTEAMNHADEGQIFSVTWRSAGGMVADLRDRGESYMDWCWEAVPCVVSERVRVAMEALGLRPVTDP